MIDLLHGRLDKADRIIVQIEGALKPYVVQRRANRPGGCYCVADRYESGDPHTPACDRLKTLYSSASWYLKKTAEMPDVLVDDRATMRFGVINAMANTADKHGLVPEQGVVLAEAIVKELESLGFRRGQ